MTGELRGIGFSVAESQANFILAGCNDCNAAEIYEKLTGLNIYVRYWNLPRLENKLRITVGTKQQNDKLIAALKQILSQ